ncbi:Uncharacterised protein [Vibrio cholerae]|nr:Uncharacterised protein [Vibrio cholerae]
MFADRLLLTPQPGKGCHPVVRTGVALWHQLVIQLFHRFTLFAWLFHLSLKRFCEQTG